MESQDGESANEVPVVRNYKHKETRNVRFYKPVSQPSFEAHPRLLCDKKRCRSWRAQARAGFTHDDPIQVVHFGALRKQQLDDLLGPDVNRHN